MGVIVGCLVFGLLYKVMGFKFRIELGGTLLHLCHVLTSGVPLFHFQGVNSKTNIVDGFKSNQDKVGPMRNPKP